MNEKGYVNEMVPDGTSVSTFFSGGDDFCPAKPQMLGRPRLRQIPQYDSARRLKKGDA
jgi:hypothetical protein